jgi:hypothetical protein
MWLRAQNDTYGGNDDSTPDGVFYRQPRYLVIMSIRRPEALRPRLSTGLPFQWEHLTARQMFSQLSVIQDTSHLCKVAAQEFSRRSTIARNAVRKGSQCRSSKIEQRTRSKDSRSKRLSIEETIGTICVGRSGLNDSSAQRERRLAVLALRVMSFETVSIHGESNVIDEEVIIGGVVAIDETEFINPCALLGHGGA